MNTRTAGISVSPPSRRNISHRLAVASRVLAALAGGYLLANAFAILLARLLLVTSMMSRADGVLTAVILSFLVYAGAVLWAFATRNATRAWAGLLLLAGAFGAIAWLLGSGAGS